ncbi:MAG TPA: SAF domain-containing protein, partial [Caulobacteraceae bacterium]
MKPARIVVIAIAAVAAVGLAIVVRAMNTGKPTTVAAAAAPEARPMARVLVAKRDLAVGARLEAGDMDWKEWPIDGLNPAYVVDGRVPPPPAPDAGAAEKAGAARAEVARVAEDLAGQTPRSAFVGAVVRE